MYESDLPIRDSWSEFHPDYVAKLYTVAIMFAVSTVLGLATLIYGEMLLRSPDPADLQSAEAVASLMREARPFLYLLVAFSAASGLLSVAASRSRRFLRWVWRSTSDAER